MSIKETREFVESLGEPFVEIYNKVTDYIMEAEDNDEKNEIACLIEGIFTEFANIHNR